MPTPTSMQTKLLFGLVALLCISQAYLLYDSFASKSASQSAEFGEGPSPMSERYDFSIGGELRYPYGEVSQAGGGMLVLATDEGTVSVEVDGDTEVYAQGAQKEQAVFQKDLDEHNARVAELIGDPEANRAALERMTIPQPFITNAISFSDIKVGQKVMVTAEGDKALSILLLP